MGATTTVRQARQRAGMSLRQLAARAGTSHATLSAYENGAKPAARTMRSRVLTLGVFAPFS